jgi:hypothetical protein
MKDVMKMLRQNNERAYKNDARKDLTLLVEKLHTLGMARLAEVIQALKQQLAQDSKRLSEIDEEIGKLRPAYNQFRDLMNEAKSKETRMLTTRTLLGEISTDEELTTAFGDEVSTPKTPDELRSGLKLWEGVVEVLRHIPQAQVGEIHTLLSLLGIKVTRQAIESAITTHKRSFRVRKYGREKFISLAD